MGCRQTHTENQSNFSKKLVRPHCETNLSKHEGPQIRVPELNRR